MAQKRAKKQGAPTAGLVRVGKGGQPEATRAPRNLTEGMALARAAEAKIWGLTEDQAAGLAIAGVAVATPLSFPEIVLDIPWSDAKAHEAWANCERFYELNHRIHRTIDTYVDLQVEEYDHSTYRVGHEYLDVPQHILAVYDDYRQNLAPDQVELGGQTEPVSRKPMTALMEELLLDGWLFGNAFVWEQEYVRHVAGRDVTLIYPKPLCPTNVEVDLKAFSVGHLRYLWRAARQERAITRGIRDEYSTYVPTEMLGATLGRESKELKRSQLAHLTYHKRAYKPYASPPLRALFSPAAQMEKLNQMDFALADGSISAVWLFTVGTDEYPALSPLHLQHAKDLVADARRTMFLVGPHTYEIKVIQPDVEGMGPAKFEQSNAAMREGLGLDLTGDPDVDAQLMVQMLDGFRNSMVTEYITDLYHRIAQLNGFKEVPRPVFPAIELRPNPSIEDALYERGILSATTYAQRRRTDYRLERLRMAREPKPEPPAVPYSSPALQDRPTGGQGAKGTKKGKMGNGATTQ